MSIQQQDDSTPQVEKGVTFNVPADFKLALDIELARRGTTLRDFCTRAIAKELGIPVPGEEGAPRRKTA